MDPLRLLSRSTNVRQGAKRPHEQTSGGRLPSGQQARPQLFAHDQNIAVPDQAVSKKRKRTHNEAEVATGFLDFFGGGFEPANAPATTPAVEVGSESVSQETGGLENVDGGEESEENVRRVLKQHKLKVTWLNPGKSTRKSKKKASTKEDKKQQNPQLYPRPLQRFSDLRTRFDISQRLQSNFRDQGYDVATEVQLAALPMLLDDAVTFLPTQKENKSQSHEHHGIDLLTVAPTGSGKTLAFLIPLFNRIARLRGKAKDEQRHTSALVLAPTKELVGQIVNEGRKIAANTGIRIAQVRKGMQLDHKAKADDKQDEDDEDEASAVKVDILVSTPGVLHSIVESDSEKEAASLPGVHSLVLDEADVLLDPLFREQTLGVWNQLPNEHLRASLWSATMGSNIEELARSVINDRRVRLSKTSSGKIPEAPLVRLVVGLKDSAVPNVQHKLIYAATEQGKLMGLRQLLHPTTSSVEAGPPLRPPFIVFTQTIERAVALHSELLYDIPAEAGGINRIAVLHSDLSDNARDRIMVRFRKGEIWVLITTDLLSRGVDFRGVNGVVNYDIPTSSAAYVHRVGRTGRAGREGGVAVTLYSKEDIPYLKHVVNVVSMAQKQSTIASSEGIQQWLLDALPTLSKNDKQKLKKRGVEARTARGMSKDPRAASKARISTKSGYVRREENKRRGAIMGSRRRAQAEAADDEGEDTEFGGFD